MPLFRGHATMSREEREDGVERNAMTVRADSRRALHGRWWSRPTTPEGQWAAVSALLAFVFGVLGEAARREEVPGPFYAVAFASGLLGGVAAIVAVRRGERSLLALLAFLPLLIGMGFGVAELLG
jgi:hypothetical protein